MIDAFAEAVRATTQPCTMLLVLPPLLAVVATGGRWQPLLGALGGAVVGGWVFMANVYVLHGRLLAVSGILVAVALVGLAAGSMRVPRLAWVRDLRVQTATCATIALVATLWWRPCVGTELGSILTAARSDGIAGQIPPMTAYMLGAMAPVVAVALAIRAIQPTPQAARLLFGGSALGAVLLGGALALGRHDDLVSTLTRWTTG